MTEQEERLYDCHSVRRARLVERLYSTHKRTGVVLLVGAFESEEMSFIQDSFFYYYTGISEPGLVLTIEVSSGKSIIWEPHYQVQRSVWSIVEQPITKESVEKYRLDDYRYSGQAVRGSSVSPFTSSQAYTELIDYIRSFSGKDNAVYALTSHASIDEASATFFTLRLLDCALPGGASKSVDIMQYASFLRCQKDADEIRCIRKAISITKNAQLAAAGAIKRGCNEAQIRAAIQTVYIECGVGPAFPGIVGAGSNATILHYNNGHAPVCGGDVVLVDIGAQYRHYCGDITRVYPASGTFTAQQANIYEHVLYIHHTVAQRARPGVWLINRDEPEQSLHHIALLCLADLGYPTSVMPHGIGHWLGLRTHDVGDYAKPLQDGDVFTIEPGIYLPDKGIGVRIEDNYAIQNGSMVCLSDDIPQSIAQIESLMKNL